MQDLLQYIPEAVSWLVGVVMGYGLKVVVNRRHDASAMSSTQTQNVVGRDQAGRDIRRGSDDG